MGTSPVVRGLLWFEGLFTLFSAGFAGFWPAAFLAQLGLVSDDPRVVALGPVIGSGYFVLGLIPIFCLRLRDPAGLRMILGAYLLGDVVAAAAFAALAAQVGWSLGVIGGLGLTVVYFCNRLAAALRPALVIPEIRSP